MRFLKFRESGSIDGTGGAVASDTASAGLGGTPTGERNPERDWAGVVAGANWYIGKKGKSPSARPPNKRGHEPPRKMISPSVDEDGNLTCSGEHAWADFGSS